MDHGDHTQAHSKEADLSASDTVISQSLKKHAQELRVMIGTPAFAVIVMRDGVVVDEIAVGERAIGSGIAVQTGDIWHMGSITKSMTATLVARLVDQDRLSWDVTITEALADQIEDIHPAFSSITFRELLSHKSGLAADIDPAKFSGYNLVSNNVRADRLDYARTMLSRPPKHLPVETHTYSNAGYIIAGAMLEALMNESWENLIIYDVFEPLGLRTAGFGPQGSSTVIDQPRGHRAESLSQQRTQVIPGASGSDNPAVLGPAGRVHMSLKDVAAYGMAHYSGTSDSGTEFLSTNSLRILHRPQLNNYAMGWVVQSGGNLLWHNGSNTMNYAELYVLPADNLVIAMVANDYDPIALPSAFNDLAKIILRDYRE